MGSFIVENKTQGTVETRHSTGSTSVGRPLTARELLRASMRQSERPSVEALTISQSSPRNPRGVPRKGKHHQSFGGVSIK